MYIALNIRVFRRFTVSVSAYACSVCISIIYNNDVSRFEDKLPLSEERRRWCVNQLPDDIIYTRVPVHNTNDFRTIIITYTRWWCVYNVLYIQIHLCICIMYIYIFIYITAVCSSTVGTHELCDYIKKIKCNIITFARTKSTKRNSRWTKCVTCQGYWLCIHLHRVYILSSFLEPGPKAVAGECLRDDCAYT